MSYPVSIVTPAYRATRTIARAARSVIAQTHADFEWIVVADDEEDYEAALGRAGIADERFRFFLTGAVGTGSPPARNIGLDAARYRHVSILDADDLFHPQKLERAVMALRSAGIVSTALRVADADLAPLRTVGEGPDATLAAGAYKFRNISMDSMLVYDRAVADPRFNPDFPCLTDIEFLLRLFAANPSVRHLGMPLHTYVKHPASVSNKPGATATMIKTKRRLLKALCAGDYPLADPEALSGLIRFYQLSLKAERGYATRLAADPTALFEDHLETVLAAAPET